MAISEFPSVTPSLIYAPDNWLDPLDWHAVFGRDAPVEVDIGCGKGAFLLWVAGSLPARNFFGVDRLLARLHRIEAKARRQDLQNVRLLRLEAGYFVSYLVPERSVSVYHIYCPDPWPKRRHQDRRLITEEFAAKLQQTLVPEGIVNFSTDDADYFHAAQTILNNTEQFREVECAPLPSESQTDFERLFAGQGKRIYRNRWQKRN